MKESDIVLSDIRLKSQNHRFRVKRTMYITFDVVIPMIVSNVNIVWQQQILESNMIEAEQFVNSYVFLHFKNEFEGGC